MNTTSNPIDVSLPQSAASRTATDASRWLVSRRFDAAVLGGALLLSLALYTSARAGAALAVAGALFAMITDMPHVIQTSIRIGLDPRERALHGRRYVTSFALITLLTFALFATDHRPIVAMIWIVWQFLHVVKQHYGIVRIYAAKNQYRGPSRLMAVTLALGCASPVLYRVGQGMRFNEYYVLDQRMPFSGLGLPNVPVPAALVWTMYAGFACAALLFVREQLGLLRRGERSLPLIAHLTLLLAIVSYNLSYLFVSDLYALIMIATAVHSLQYHAISWRRNHGQYAQGRGELPQASLLEVLSRRENVVAYAALSLVAGAAIASTETLWLGFIPFVVVLHHFYMDGFVWRSALNPTLATDLGIPSRRAAAAQGAA